MRGTGQRLRLLLVEDDPGDAARIREMLLDVPGSPFAVRWAEDLEKALSHLTKGETDLVLADLDLPESTGLATFLKLHRAAPRLPVIILGSREDDSFALKAVRHGAEDFLVKGSLTAGALAKCVRYTIERHSRRRIVGRPSLRRVKPRGRVLGFLGAKGGVGTTTTALNVAASLATAGQDVLLVESRGHYGTLASHFGDQLPPSNLASLLEGPPEEITEAALNTYLVKYSSHLRVLFGPQRAAQTRRLDTAHAKAVLDALAHMARFVVLDLPSEPSEGVREAVLGSDFLGLVLDREAGSLAAAEVMIEHVRRWGAEALIGAVIVHRSPLACPLELGEITGRLKCGIMALIPPAADTCILAQNAGAPVVESHPDALVADSLRKLALKLAEDPIVIKKTA